MNNNIGPADQLPLHTGASKLYMAIGIGAAVVSAAGAIASAQGNSDVGQKCLISAAGVFTALGVRLFCCTNECLGSAYASLKQRVRSISLPRVAQAVNRVEFVNVVQNEASQQV